MFKTIVWATDGSEDAERALPTLIDLVRENDAKLIVVHADVRLGGRSGGYPLLADERELRTALEHKVKELAESGIDASLHIITGHGEAADLVADAATEAGADVVVVATRGHGRVAGMLLGSVTQRLLHVAPCPVLAVPVLVPAPAAAAPN
jgi:nucleotide-binding universal stress UspA family protein